VLDPTVEYTPALDMSTAILFEGRIDTSERRPTKYDLIASDKARVSWRTGLPSRVVQQSSPHLYVSRDTKWGGSVVREGIVVAFSGVQAVYDEWIAGMMADLLVAMCRDEMTKDDGVMARDEARLG